MTRDQGSFNPMHFLECRVCFIIWFLENTRIGDKLGISLLIIQFELCTLAGSLGICEQAESEGTKVFCLWLTAKRYSIPVLFFHQGTLDDWVHEVAIDWCSWDLNLSYQLLHERKSVIHCSVLRLWRGKAPRMITKSWKTLLTDPLSSSCVPFPFFSILEIEWSS